MLHPQAIEHLANHEVHQVVDGLGTGIKTRHRRNHPCPHPGQPQHVLQVDLVQRGLAGDDHQGTPLLQDDVGAPLQEVPRIARGNAGKGPHAAGQITMASGALEPLAMEAQKSFSSKYAGGRKAWHFPRK